MPGAAMQMKRTIPPDMDQSPERDRILVVDDDEITVGLVRRILERNGYPVDTALKADSARSAMTERTYSLILCDIDMPGESGLEFVASIGEGFPETAAMMISGIDDPRTAAQALDLGVYGYIIKPFEPNEILINVANALRRRKLELASMRHQEELEHQVELRTAALRQTLDKLRVTLDRLERASLDTIVRLSRAGEYKDQDTGEHILRMSRYAAALARHIGLGERVARSILYASPMHDVGKIGIPDNLLLKPGPLTMEEWEVMKTHTTIGARILAGAEHGFLRLAEVIAQTHHERWDGDGYPRGLVGKKIPLAGQIVGLADMFDALTSVRPYKPAFDLDKTCEMIGKTRGMHFRPDLVDAFLEIRPQLEEIKESYKGGPIELHRQLELLVR